MSPPRGAAGVALAALLFLSACATPAPSPATPPAPPAPGTCASPAPVRVSAAALAADFSGTLFTQVSGSGVEFVKSRCPGTDERFGLMGGGAAMADYDNDGDLDLFFTQGGPDALYRNDGNWRFTEVAAAAGVADPGEGRAAAWGDYDNDGCPDLYVANLGTSNRLYRNNCDSTFTDVTGRAGAGHAGHTYHVAWGDYDRDGCLDLYLANYVDARALYAEPAHAAYDFARRDGEPNRLFRSNCEGTFTDVTQKSGTGDSGYALGAAFTDLDGDGWPDLYVSNDFGPNLLLRNLGDGAFEDVTTASGTGYRANGMGVDSGDVDNDGDLDLYVPNIFWVQYLGDVLGLPPGDDGGRAEALRSLLRQDSALLKRLPDRWRDSLPRMVEMGSALYLNRGGLAFTEEARAAGVHAVEWGWGGLFLDADLDGDIDLYVANGFDPYGHRRFFQLPNRLFLNLGNGTFSEAAARAGAGDRGDSRGAAYGDLDGDGALDLAVVNQGGPARLYRGDPPPGNHWLVVKPVGSCGPDHRGGAPLPGPRPSRLDATAGGVGGPASCSNRDGIGARVTVRAGNLSLLREVKSGSGHSSGSMIPVHFGLGENGSVGELTVRWPSGRVTTLLDVKADRALVVREPSG